MSWYPHPFKRMIGAVSLEYDRAIDNGLIRLRVVESGIPVVIHLAPEEAAEIIVEGLSAMLAAMARGE